MILLQKDRTIWLTNCAGRKVYKLDECRGDDLQGYLDTNVILEEGITLKNIVALMLLFGIYFPMMEDIDCEKIDDDYEYISIIPKYSLDIKNNGVNIISKMYNIMNLELSDGDTIFIFDYMLTNQLLDLEVRIERDVIEYNDAKYYMAPEMTVRELFLAISDGILDSSSD